MTEKDRQQARRKIDHTEYRKVAGPPYTDVTKLKNAKIDLLATAARPPHLLWLSIKSK